MLSATDAHDHSTRFQYKWGVVEITETPEFTTSRGIKRDSTIEWEIRRGLKTEFGYDALGRLTSVTPPLGYPFTTVYDNTGGRWIEQRRWNPENEGSTTTFTLDGFGRRIASLNSVGIRTRTQYDVFGRRTYQSQPFKTTEDGDVFSYDELDRLDEVRHTAEGTRVTYQYPGALDVHITEYTAANESRGRERQES